MKKIELLAVAVLALGLAACGKKDKAVETLPGVEVAESQLPPALKNAKEGQDFLAENAKRPEVKVTPSGLQYEVLQEGDGPKPEATNKVTVNYEGRLINGTVFDSSYQRGEPISFPLQQVIPGWTEGLQLMPKGSKYRLYIPSELAYGEKGTPGGPIGPNCALIFDVELIDFE